MRYFAILLLFIGFTNCSKEENNKIDVSNIVINTNVQRFEQKFYTTPVENLGELKSEFPYLFPEANPDSVWINKMKNKDEQDLFEASQKLYADFGDEQDQLNSLFQHIKYYYPNFKAPKVITILSNVDYNNNVVLADSLLFISLDVFLGKDSEVYREFPKYIKQNYTKSHLIVSVGEKFTQNIIAPAKSKSFVSRIIQEGKRLALNQAFLPNVQAEEIIGYTRDQFVWAEKSEIEIWKYFIERAMLYSTDTQLSARFIEEAPFSKFFLEVDKDSPGKIGAWFGWQIVNSYMKNNKVTLQQTMKTDNEDIFKKSKYKPKKR